MKLKEVVLVLNKGLNVFVRNTTENDLHEYYNDLSLESINHPKMLNWANCDVYSIDAPMNNRIDIYIKSSDNVSDDKNTTSSQSSEKPESHAATLFTPSSQTVFMVK